MSQIAQCARVSLDYGILLLIAAATVCAAPALAASPDDHSYRFESGTGHIRLESSLFEFADPSREMTIDDMIGGDLAWSPCETGVPVYGFSDAAHWIHFHLRNESDDEDFVFSFDYSVADVVEVHQVQDGKLIDSEYLGDAKPFADRSVKHHSFVVPVRLGPDAERDFYVRIMSKSSIQAPMTFWSKAEFIRTSNIDYLAHGLFFGIMLAMAAYGVFVYASVRDMNYLLFAVYSLLFTGIPATMRGFSYQLIWPGSEWLQEKSFLIFVPAVAAVSFVFAARVMNLRHHMPRMARAFRILAVASTALIVPIVLLDYQLVIQPVLALALLEEVFISAIGIRTWKRYGSRPALLFTLAWLAFFVGSCAMILNRFGLIPRSLATEMGPSLGILAMATVMAMALAESLRETRRERREAKIALKTHLEEASFKLEQEVHRRTADLQEVMRQLAEVNEEFETINKQDGLTGVFNRASFDERLEMEFMGAWEDEDEVSVIMIDIDHFKNFNDSYGHQIGDECLIQVARTIDQAARSTQDFTARYGGEEFSVIVSHTPAETVAGVGERIRAAVEAMDFRVDDERVPVTVSVGVATIVPDADDLPEALVAVADAALYAAKERGRNRVEVHEPVVSCPLPTN